MKTSLQNILFVIGISGILLSCSSIKETAENADFQKRWASADIVKKRPSYIYYQNQAEKEITTASLNSEESIIISNTNNINIERSETAAYHTTENELESNISSKKQLKKEIKTLLKESNLRDDTDFLLLVIISILIPPLAVFIQFGISNEFWIDLILTLLFFLPGLIYALYLLFRDN